MNKIPPKVKERPRKFRKVLNLLLTEKFFGKNDDIFLMMSEKNGFKILSRAANNCSWQLRLRWSKFPWAPCVASLRAGCFRCAFHR